MVEKFAWLVLLLPLLSAAVIALFTHKNHKLSAQISIAAVLASFVFSLLLLALLPETASDFKVNWLTVGDAAKEHGIRLVVDIGLHLDNLSKLMLLIVTGVGSAIHIYSFGYMHDDRCFSRFFASLSLFTFSMLGIVLADNFLMMFIFWELVGVSSYLLIGFWYEKASAADACKKAFLTNRIGDLGFMLGILVVWATLGSLNFGKLQEAIAADTGRWAMVSTIAGLLVFCGAMGKSAQFPLHVWLPDAMEGPTPVSALIHAATMVAAGVYMLSRVYFIFDLPALEVIAWIGGFTSLLAALIAVQQNDIKRILAYSTLSQLGYMVMAVGLQGPQVAMFHLTTHAFFKAMLFLGAGSVIHALHHEQDIWKMGGLKKHMPVTYWTFFIGTLALCGVPPFSGFYSKDGILAQAFEHNIALYVVATLVAVLTTFYMFRLFFVAFEGQPRSEASEHAHESPGVMVWPLRILAVPSIFAGVLGIDHYIGASFPALGEAHGHSFNDLLLGPFGHAPLAAIFGLLAVVVGWTAAFVLYSGTSEDRLPLAFGWVARAMRNRFYFDEVYEKLIAVSQEALAKFADGIDRWIISGLVVRGAHGSVELFGRGLRLVQSGNLQTYAFLFVMGAAVVLYFVLAH